MQIKPISALYVKVNRTALANSGVLSCLTFYRWTEFSWCL